MNYRVIYPDKQPRYFYRESSAIKRAKKIKGIVQIKNEFEWFDLEVKQMEQTKFDKECDVFFEDCKDNELDFDKYDSSIIIMALETFKTEILKNSLKEK